MTQPSTTIYPAPSKATKETTTRPGSTRSCPNDDALRIRLGPRDMAAVHFLYMAGYARTDQIAEGCFQAVPPKNRARVTQRRLKQLFDAEIVRRIEQPIYPSERAGSKPFIYALGSSGAALVAQQLGLPLWTVDWRPRAREKNISWLQHALALVDYYLALKRSCSEAEIALESWVTDRILQKEADRVEITNMRGTTVEIGVVPDACYVLGLPQRVATVLLEYDRGTITLEPGADAWTQKGWRRKVLGLLALADNGKLKQHYGADSLFVTVVTTGEARLANMVKTTEKAAGERAHHFWFTSEDLLAHNILRDPIWTVAGKPGKRHALL